MNKQKSDRPLLEATLESGEVVLDALMNGDALADIPFIGTAVKVCRAKDTIRDRIFAVKLQGFIECLQKITQKEKDKMREKIASNPEEAGKVGETLVMVLEQITDLNKPSVLAKLFLCYIEEIISANELRRLAQAINIAFGDDLILFLLAPSIRETSKVAWLESLVPAGLARVAVGKTWNDVGAVYFNVTPLGEVLRSAHLKRPLL